LTDIDNSADARPAQEIHSSATQKASAYQGKRKILFDIETVGRTIESFSEEEQKYLLKGVKTEEDLENAKLSLNLYPTTAEIVCIGMFDIDLKYAGVFYQSKTETEEYMLSQIEREDWLDELFQNGSIKEAKFYPMDEKQMLIKFWDTIKDYRQFITFNGRTFDCPFILLRSAYHKVKPSRDLVPYRYSIEPHCDLLDQLTFYGALRRFNLDFYCKFFNIVSPKSHGITGLDMNKLFSEGRFSEIAKYCLGDIQSTAKLFEVWEEYLNPKNIK
jgi:DNA polymerase elongation subunit (family B)